LDDYLFGRLTYKTGKNIFYRDYAISIVDATDVEICIEDNLIDGRSIPISGEGGTVAIKITMIG